MLLTLRESSAVAGSYVRELRDENVRGLHSSVVLASLTLGCVSGPRYLNQSNTFVCSTTGSHYQERPAR